jgi:hypothetical protein
MIDPYAEKKRPWGWYIAIVIILLLALGWISGRFDHALSVVSPKITSSYILHNQPLPGLDQSAPKVEQKK